MLPRMVMFFTPPDSEHPLVRIEMTPEHCIAVIKAITKDHEASVLRCREVYVYGTLSADREGVRRGR